MNSIKVNIKKMITPIKNTLKILIKKLIFNLLDKIN